jgi:homogentisate 1,2-dioxygenase
MGAPIVWDSNVQEPVFDIDLEHDTASVFLTVMIPKSTDDIFVAQFLRMVSRAFAETEGVSEDWMHAVLEKEVRGFEDATHIKFVWQRSFRGKGPRYPQRLGENLAKQRPSRTLN